MARLLPNRDKRLRQATTRMKLTTVDRLNVHKLVWGLERDMVPAFHAVVAAGEVCYAELGDHVGPWLSWRNEGQSTARVCPHCGEPVDPPGVLSAPIGRPTDPAKTPT